MKILITGGTGFLGTAVTKALRDNGHEVYRYDRRDGQDVLDTAQITTWVRGMDSVIHLAGMLGTDELFDDVHNAIDVNIHGTVNVLDACVSAGAGYVGITMPKSPWINIYNSTKLCAVNIARSYHQYHNLPVSHVRAFNAYGVGQAHGLGHPRKIVPSFASRSWAGDPIQIWGDGEQTVDLIGATEIGHVFAGAVHHGEDQIFDAGTGHAVTVNQVADMVQDVTGSKVFHEHLPMRRGETPNTQIVAEGEGWDILGWRPQFDTEEFIRTVNYYK